MTLKDMIDGILFLFWEFPPARMAILLLLLEIVFKQIKKVTRY